MKIPLVKEVISSATTNPMKILSSDIVILPIYITASKSFIAGCHKIGKTQYQLSYARIYEKCVRYSWM